LTYIRGGTRDRLGCPGVKKNFLLLKPLTGRDLATLQTRSFYLTVHIEYYLILS